MEHFRIKESDGTLLLIVVTILFSLFLEMIILIQKASNCNFDNSHLVFLFAQTKHVLGEVFLLKNQAEADMESRILGLVLDGCGVAVDGVSQVSQRLGTLDVAALYIIVF